MFLFEIYIDTCSNIFSLLFLMFIFSSFSFSHFLGDDHGYWSGFFAYTSSHTHIFNLTRFCQINSRSCTHLDSISSVWIFSFLHILLTTRYFGGFKFCFYKKTDEYEMAPHYFAFLTLLVKNFVFCWLSEIPTNLLPVVWISNTFLQWVVFKLCLKYFIV